MKMTTIYGKTKLKAITIDLLQLLFKFPSTSTSGKTMIWIVSLTIPLIEDNVTGTNHQLPLEGIVALTILRMNIMITRTNLQLPLEIVMKATFDLYAKIITSQYALK